MSLQDASFICLIIFSILGAFDGLYYHLIKFQLHKHPSSKTEHLIHTIRGYVFAGIGLLIFAHNSQGSLLYLAIALIAVDMFLEIVDIKVEKSARAPLGGIDPNESVLHVFASSFKFAAMVLILLSKPMSAFDLGADAFADDGVSTPLQIFAYGFTIVTIVVSTYSLFGEYINEYVTKQTNLLFGKTEADLEQNPSADVSIPFRRRSFGVARKRI